MDRIGGLAPQLALIREMVEVPLLNPESFTSLGMRPMRGVLLYGPPGTGKTMVAQAIAEQIDARLFVINGPEVMSKFVGESEERLRSVFERARKAAPSIIFIDEIDSLCASRERSTDEVEKRMVATMLTLMDGIVQNERVVVIGATNRVNSLDSAVRRPGRFDREVEIGIPGQSERLDILRRVLTSMPNDVSDDALREVASITHGYVGADLFSLCREAALCALHRFNSVADGGGQLSLRALKIDESDLKAAMALITPSAMREVAVDVPDVTWADVGGQEQVKQQLREAVQWPLERADDFRRLGIRAPRGILLYGPPGCAKTLLVKALANESSQNFLAVKGPELFSKWVGDSEKAVQEVFRKARAAAPSIVFFDEIDAIAPSRGSGDDRVAERVLSQLLVEMDGMDALRDVTVVAATNRPDVVDPALLRPGRMDRLVYVPPPDATTALAILRVSLAKVSVGDDVDMRALVDDLVGLSGAEIVAVCREAAVLAMEEDVRAACLCQRHLVRAARGFESRISDAMIKFYEEFRSRTE
eukprot:TRINITY_DN104690_c0_g1_i1.p1 TRINITY_DN104690_c0_g1~~TRINITY_DN104690_c0_g1_i1.p1  ORF type:complete len:533 (+),score=249.38 TRINITY_DN104690_c0_g1_i1:2-1600(+)